MNYIKFLRTAEHIPTETFIRYMQGKYPAFDKTVVSLAERPHQTGVEYTPSARREAFKFLGKEPEERKDRNHISAWLSDETFHQLNEIQKTLGADTYKYVLRMAIWHEYMRTVIGEEVPNC